MMSLKGFHLFFITVSIILAIGFAGWEVRNFASTGEALSLVAALASLVIGVGLIMYLVKVRQKLKGMGS
jgi:hypothetical protein